MASTGAEVTTVDPLVNPDDDLIWEFTDVEYAKLNRAFGNRVTFVRKFLEDAALPEHGYDRVVACSVIEHIPHDSAMSLMREIGRVLKPGGRFIATIDLFLDTVPFTDRPRNLWGTNVSVRALVEASGLRILVGNKAELYGYPEFDAETIRRNRDRYLDVNDVLTQCIVLEK
jgi:SAM-dependent methyltransferase